MGYEFPPHVLGGVASYTHDLARLLSERKIQTTVFCGKSRKLIEEQLNEYLTVVRLPILNLPPRFYWFQILNYSHLRQRLHQFDVVHAVDPQTSAVCALIRHQHESMVTTIHNVPVYRAKAFFNSPPSEWGIYDFISHFAEMSLGNKLCTFCFNKSQKIVSVSETVRQQAKVAFGDTVIKKTTVIPNGISFKELEEKWPEDTSEGDLEPFVLFYGRLVTLKGIPLLFRAWTHLQRRFPKIKLMVIGAGPLLGKLRALLGEFAISESVEIRDYMPRRDLITIVRRSLAVVLPSSYEGASLAILEAMACSKPVVALDYPFAREIIENYHSGLLALPGDEKDLARKIQLVIEDEDLRKKLGRNAHEHVYQNHNWDKLVERYITLYQSLADNHNENA